MRTLLLSTAALSTWTAVAVAAPAPASVPATPPAERAVLVAAPAKTTNSQHQQAILARLLGTRWRAVAIAGRPVTRDVTSTLIFASAVRVQGHAGCNSYSGSLSLVGDRLRIGSLISTRIACLPVVMDQERRFLAALGTARRLAFDGPSLLLYSSDQRAPTRLTRVKEGAGNLPPAIFRHWIHSWEEDTADLEVFRPEGFAFPPSFGRDGFEMRKNGRFIQDDIGPADGVVQVLGRWTLLGPRRVLVSFDGTAREGYSFEIVAVDESVLRIRREAQQGVP